MLVVVVIGTIGETHSMLNALDLLMDDSVAAATNVVREVGRVLVVSWCTMEIPSLLNVLDLRGKGSKNARTIVVRVHLARVTGIQAAIQSLGLKHPSLFKVAML